MLQINVYCRLTTVDMITMMVTIHATTGEKSCSYEQTACNALDVTASNTLVECIFNEGEFTPKPHHACMSDNVVSTDFSEVQYLLQYQMNFFIFLIIKTVSDSQTIFK